MGKAREEREGQRMPEKARKGQKRPEKAGKDWTNMDARTQPQGNRVNVQDKHAGQTRRPNTQAKCTGKKHRHA